MAADDMSMFNFRTPEGNIHPAVKGAAAGAVAAWLIVAIPLVARFEGFFGKPYFDSVGVKTICYGATASDHVDFSKVYTKAECEKMLGDDLPKYNAMARKCVPGIDAMPPHRHAAIVSFVYNLGPGALCGPVGRNLNAGNISAGCLDMLAYDHGRVHGHMVRIKGLTDRRRAEYLLCMRSD